jgi:hypothetical protein
MSTSKPGSRGVEFLVIGDWGAQSAPNQTLVAGAMNAFALERGQDFVVSVGDNVYKYGLNEKDDPLWHETWTDVYWKNGSMQGLRGLDWYSVLGNHDYGAVTGHCEDKSSMASCMASGGRPEFQIGAKRNEAANATYYLDYNYSKSFGNGLLDVCFVDTNPLVDHYRTKMDAYNTANGLPAVAWSVVMDQLEACLAESTATVKHVVGHESPYSNGAEQGGYPELRPLFGPLFKKYGVDVYFAGHSHDLEHLFAPEGYHVVISGSGGGDIQYGFNGTAHSYFQGPNPGFVGVSVSEDGGTRVKFYGTERAEALYQFSTKDTFNDTGSLIDPGPDWYTSSPQTSGHLPESLGALLLAATVIGFVF